ncbi:MAG: carboxy terminal-processing peptidase, partial [Leptospirales bacterium]|nr:carboxy terminal-processing peptidase [Leptospirales bacterium]
SASASEIIAGVIKDYRRGLIVGSSNTFGKGTVQSYNELGGKRGAIKVTTHIFYQPSGTSNQLNGIAPDVTIPDITSVWDVGENKGRYPLKWVPIPVARFNFVGMVSPEIASALQSLSRRRTASDKDFKELQIKIDTLKKQISRKSISLKEESSIEKQKENELGKSLNRGNKKIIDLENDLFLKEAFNVTKDYIKMVK